MSAFTKLPPCKSKKTQNKKRLLVLGSWWRTAARTGSRLAHQLISAEGKSDATPG